MGTLMTFLNALGKYAAWIIGALALGYGAYTAVAWAVIALGVVPMLVIGALVIGVMIGAAAITATRPDPPSPPTTG